MTTARDLDRLPPQDLAAEMCVLGGMMLSKDAIADVIEILRADDFYRPTHVTIFNAIIDLYNQNSPVDAITVNDRLTSTGDLARVGGATYLYDCRAAVPTAANTSYYACIVADRAKFRRLVDAGTGIVQLGYTPADDADQVVDQAQQLLFDIANRRTHGDGLTEFADLMQPTLDEIEAAGVSGGALRGIPTGFIDLDRLLNGLAPGQLIVVAGRPSMGKALALDTPLVTPDGWTTMGSVQVGDWLLGADGQPTRVLATSEIMTGRACYEVHFSDGSIIVADGEHLWSITTRASRRQASRDDPGPPRGAKHTGVATTAQIAAQLQTNTATRRWNYAVANALALQLPVADLPVAPYTLGVWLGDGHSAAARFTTADPEIITYIEADGYVVSNNGRMAYAIKQQPLPPLAAKICPVCGIKFIPRGPTTLTCSRQCGCSTAGRALGPPPALRCETCGEIVSSKSAVARRCAPCHARHASVAGELRNLGVLGNKHIPIAYLRASESQRRALLAGLLDTDGTVTNSGGVQFVVTSQRLAEDVRQLVVSLGYRCGVATRRVKGRTEATSTAYLINFTTLDEVFRLSRKRLTHKQRQRPGGATRTGQRSIVDVRRIGTVPVRCVHVDNATHLYLAGRSMIPTHNSTLAVNIAQNASFRHGLTSAIFSMEMSKVEIVMRMLSAEARVPLNTLRSGQLSDDDWTKLARRMGEISEAPIFVDDTPNMNLMEIRAKARRLRQRHDLKLIVVDYLQLMTGAAAKSQQSEQERISDLARGLKLLAKEVDVPVIAVSQLNRGPEGRTDKRPLLSDLRGSGAIEQDADIVILLHREDYYDKESSRAGEAEFIVAKHRNGPTDTISVAAQLHLSRFVDMSFG